MVKLHHTVSSKFFFSAFKERLNHSAMPSIADYGKFLFVNLGFIALVAVMMYSKSAVEIRENWPKYRCNPPYWVFSTDLSADFTYCIQNTQTSMMGYMLQPLTQLTSSLATMGGSLGKSLNSARQMISNMRGFVATIIQSIFGVFLNLLVEFQKIMVSMRDMVGKTTGIVMSIMYIMDGSIKTMNSTWRGPPGQMVRAIGSCFHPSTPIRCASGTLMRMADLPVGEVLVDGSVVFSVMNIANLTPDLTPLYKIPDSLVAGGYIYVTGTHFIYYEFLGSFIQVKDIPGVELAPSSAFTSEFACLITTKGTIPIGEHIFWDWEDDELNIIDHTQPQSS